MEELFKTRSAARSTLVSLLVLPGVSSARLNACSARLRTSTAFKTAIILDRFLSKMISKQVSSADPSAWGPLRFSHKAISAHG